MTVPFIICDKNQRTVKFWKTRYTLTMLLVPLLLSGSAQTPWPNTVEVIVKYCEMRFSKNGQPITYGANEFIESKNSFKNGGVEICRWVVKCCEETVKPGSTIRLQPD